MRIIIIAVIFISSIITGCSRKIDATSQYSMKDSIEKIQKSLSTDEQKEFEQALSIIMISEARNFDSTKVSSPDYVYEMYQKLFDGKTAKELIAQSKEIKAREKEREKERVIKEINELETLKKSVIEDKIQLNKFRLTLTDIYNESIKYRRNKQLIIKLSMKNGTEYPISAGKFTGTLKEPGRSIPWLEENFSFEIPGGIEPGEVINLRLEPKYSSSLPYINLSNDMNFIVETIAIAGSDNDPLFTVCKFTEDDEIKLRELKESIEDENIATSIQYKYRRRVNRNKKCSESRYNQAFKIYLER